MLFHRVNVLVHHLDVLFQRRDVLRRLVNVLVRDKNVLLQLRDVLFQRIDGVEVLEEHVHATDEDVFPAAVSHSGGAVDDYGTAERFLLMEEAGVTLRVVAAACEWFVRPGLKLMKTLKTKVPLPEIKTRSTETQIVMEALAGETPPWMAPGIVSTGNFLNMIQGLTTQENFLSLKEAELAVAAGEWDSILDPWHDESVTVLKFGRLHWARTPKAPAWRPLSANGGGRDRVTKEGTDIESAWKSSSEAWVPKAGMTFTNFVARRTTADAKGRLYSLADKAVDEERGMLIVQANAIYDICVEWYALATANFGADTPQGALIRTIPVNYNPNAAPGQLHFSQHYSPAPNQLKLVWEAGRGEHFNIYAKAPGATEFVKILNHVSQTSWMGEGMAAGQWAFKGEAVNADGLGEMSEVIVVPVMAALAA